MFHCSLCCFITICNYWMLCSYPPPVYMVPGSTKRYSLQLKMRCDDFVTFLIFLSHFPLSPSIISLLFSSTSLSLCSLYIPTVFHNEFIIRSMVGDNSCSLSHPKHFWKRFWLQHCSLLVWHWRKASIGPSDRLYPTSVRVGLYQPGPGFGHSISSAQNFWNARQRARPA